MGADVHFGLWPSVIDYCIGANQRSTLMTMDSRGSEPGLENDAAGFGERDVRAKSDELIVADGRRSWKDRN
jgi:hypothetical protein